MSILFFGSPRMEFRICFLWTRTRPSKPLKLKNSVFSNFVQLFSLHICIDNFKSWLEDAYDMKFCKLSQYMQLNSLQQKSFSSWDLNAFNNIISFPNSQIRWIHQDTPVSELLTKWPASEWRLELRVRYLPANLRDLCDADRVTFHYYYDQVFEYTLIKVIIISIVLFSYSLNLAAWKMVSSL